MFIFPLDLSEKKKIMNPDWIMLKLVIMIQNLEDLWRKIQCFGK